MAASVTAFTTHKGGPGKTTTTQNLAIEIAKTGKKVLMGDIDGQGNLTTVFGFEKDDISYGMSDILNDEKFNIEKAILKTDTKGLDIIPSNRDTYFAEKDLATKSGREFVLSDQLEKVKGKYDYIFLDTPPNLGLLTFSAIVASNNILLIYK